MKIPQQNKKKGNITTLKTNKCRSDIIFIPPLPNPVYTDQTENFMPLGLLALTAALKKHNCRSEIYKPSIRIYSRKDIIKVAKDILSKEPQSIGFSTWCVSYTTSLIIAENLKKIDPTIPIIFGGPHASVTDSLTLNKYLFIDYILQGEADHSLVSLLLTLFKKDPVQEALNIPGLIYRDRITGEIRRNEEKPGIPDLDDLPIPAYDLSSAKTIKLDIGRGCPFKCTFCSTSDFFSRKHRVKSPERVIEELDYCYEKTGITSYGFSHDMFTTDKKYVLSLCNELNKYTEQKRIPISWTCSSRPDTVNFELLKNMKDAGCQTIFFGLESGSPKIQKSVKKNLNLTKVLQVAEWCSDLKIQMIASFMAGFPGEDEDDIDQTIKLILKLIGKGAKPQMSLLSVLPGTGIYEKYHESLLFDGRFSDFSSYQPTPEEYKMIKNDPALFSSFHYLPVENLTRDQLYSLSRLVNNIREFRYTSKILADYFSHDLDRIQLFKPLMDNLEKYRKNNAYYTELFFLMDIMDSLINNTGKNGLPDYSRDLFIAETAQVVVKRKFLKKQLIKPQPGKRENILQITNAKNKIAINPNWVQITTSYEILKLFKGLKTNETIVPESAKKKGKYHYLVIAKSEKSSELLMINKDQSILLDSLNGGSVSQILNENSIDYPISKLFNLLNQLCRYGAIDVVK